MSKKSIRYTDEFKKQIVSLINTGKPTKEVIDEYKISRSTIFKWVNNYNNTNSFKAKDNRSEDENELKDLLKEIKQLKMENDILKQAALILGRK